MQRAMLAQPELITDSFIFAFYALCGFSLLEPFDVNKREMSRAHHHNGCSVGGPTSFRRPALAHRLRKRSQKQNIFLLSLSLDLGKPERDVPPHCHPNYSLERTIFCNSCHPLCNIIDIFFCKFS